MSKDLNKHELLKRIFDYFDNSHVEYESKLVNKKFDDRLLLLNELCGFNKAVIDIIDIIRDYNKELNGDTFQQLKAINEELKKINEELSKKGGV